MKIKHWAAIVGGMIALGAVCCILTCAFNPARRTDSDIRDEVLRYTPLGTEGDQVCKQVTRRFRDARVMHAFTETGWANKSIHANYGVYQSWSNFPWATVVDISWVFDDEGKLKSVSVERYVDSI